jgi:hypothetical protein
MSRRGLGGPEKGLQSVMFHRQLLLTHAPSCSSRRGGQEAALRCSREQLDEAVRQLSEEIDSDLEAVRGRFDDWELRRGGWAALEDGLLRSYGRGHRKRSVVRARRALAREPSRMAQAGQGRLVPPAAAPAGLRAHRPRSGQGGQPPRRCAGRRSRPRRPEHDSRPDRAGPRDCTPRSRSDSCGACTAIGRPVGRTVVPRRIVIPPSSRT